MLILKFMLGISWFYLVGYSILSFIYPRRGEFFFLEKWSISFGLGVGVLSCEMLFLSMMGLKFNTVVMIVPWIVLFMIVLYKNKGKIDFKKMITSPKALQSISRIEFVLLMGITFEIIMVVIEAVIQPIHGMDSMAMWSYKSKIFFFEGSVPWNLINVQGFRQPSYPLLTSLMETWVYLWIGEISDWLINLMRPFFFLSLLIVCYFSMRRFMERKFSLLFLFILSSVPIFTHISAQRLADVPLSFFYFIAIVALFRWMENPTNKDAILAGLFLGFAMFTKQEGKALFAVTFLVLTSFCFFNTHKGTKKILRHILLVSAIAIGITGPWDFYVLYHGLGVGHDVLAVFSKLGEVPSFMSHWFYRMTTLYFWNILWPSFLLITILFHNYGLFHLKGRIIYIYSVIPIYFFLLIFIFTARFSSLHFDPRVLLPLIPLSLFVMSLLISNYINQFPVSLSILVKGDQEILSPGRNPLRANFDMRKYPDLNGREGGFR